MALDNALEIALLIFLILGVIFSFILPNPVMQSIAIFIFGILIVVVSHMKKLELNFPYVFVVVGFILGYLIATTQGFRLVILIVFLAGIFAGLYLKKVLKKHIEMKK